MCRRAALTVVLVALAASCSDESNLARRSGPTKMGGSDKAVVVEWAAPNHDDSNTRESRLSAITSKNIGTLAVGWTAAVVGHGFFGALAGMNPIVVGGTVYFQDLRSNVYAADAKTGASRWKKEYNTDIIGPHGPAVENGMVFVQTGMSTIAALDGRDGRELWSKSMASSDTQSITIQMAARDGTVYFSTAPVSNSGGFYPPGGMGILYALDARTGDQKWSFNTVKDGDLWGHPEVNSGGGSWYPPAIDRASGTTYWGTGNPGPFPGTADYSNGSSRPGPNPYTNSMVAIDKFGKLKWARQVTPHDLFDYDFAAPPILTTVTVRGVPRRMVVGGGKAGRVVAFDADVGDVLWAVSVGVHRNDELTSLPVDEPIVVSPGFLGGVMSPMALSEERQLLYVPVANTLAGYTSTRQVPALGGTGELVALDVRDGHVVWKADLDSGVYAGATVLRDLVVTATGQGKVAAFDPKSGKEVWTWQAEAGISAPIAVTGDSLLVPVGMGASPKVVSLRLPGPSPLPAGG